MEEIFAVIGLALEVNTVNQDGMLAIAAYGVADKLIQTVYIIGLSFQTMGTVVTGQFIGSKKIKESTKVIKEGMKLSIFPSILLILIVSILIIIDILLQNFHIFTFVNESILFRLQSYQWHVVK